MIIASLSAINFIVCYHKIVQQNGGPERSNSDDQKSHIISSIFQGHLVGGTPRLERRSGTSVQLTSIFDIFNPLWSLFYAQIDLTVPLFLQKIGIVSITFSSRDILI